MVDALGDAPAAVTTPGDTRPIDPPALRIDTAGATPAEVDYYARPDIEYYDRNAQEDPSSARYLDSRDRGAYILRPDDEAFRNGERDPIFYSAHGRDGSVFYTYEGRPYFSPNPDGPRSVDDDEQGRGGIIMRADYIPLTSAEAAFVTEALQERHTGTGVHPDIEKYHALARQRTALVAEAEAALDEMYPERLRSPHPRERYKPRPEEPQEGLTDQSPSDRQS